LVRFALVSPAERERVPDLAVVVVDYNAGDYLMRCLDSLGRHAGDATLEVVVVDNASRDGSARRAKEAHPEITLVENPDNRGLSAALNQGIRWTHAPFVLLMNPDAEVSTGTLSGWLKVAEDRPRVGVLGPLVREPDGTVYPSGRVFPSIVDAVGHAFLHPFRPDNPFSRRYLMADWGRSTERVVDWVSMACMLVRRTALEQVGMLDESFFLYGEELDICTRLQKAGWSVLFTPEVEVTHEGGVSTGRSRRTMLMHSRSVYRYFAKHRAGGWRRVLLPFARIVLRLRAELVSMRLRHPRP
jgi:N-acetylglucosaminyl-diphospho-decaprenol L-rhamnosyltransferase